MREPIVKVGRSLGLLVALTGIGCGEAGDLGEADEEVVSAALIGQAKGCLYLDPPSDQVYIYHDPNYVTCSALPVGLYPQWSVMGMQNDSISAIKVGSNVRFRTFRDYTYSGSFYVWYQGGKYPALSTYGWNDSISSARVEWAYRNEQCADVQDGEMALFRDRNGTGDCVVLPTDISYPTAAEMGIKNDSISSVIYRGRNQAYLFYDPWYTGSWSGLPYTTQPYNLKQDYCDLGIFCYNNIEDSTSSIRIDN